MLRPLTTIEVLDAAWQLLRRNWQAWYAISSVGTLPLALASMIYFLWLGTLVEGTERQDYYLGTAVWAVVMAAAWSLNSVARAVVTLGALADVRGEPDPLSGAWRRAWKASPGSVFVGLVGFGAAWVASGCVVFPGLMLAAGWWVARPALLEEGRPFSAALRRSWRLTAGHRAKSFGLWALLTVMWAAGSLNLHLLVQFLVGSASGILGVETSALQSRLQPGNQAYVVFLAAVMFVLLDPLKTAVDAVLYLDLRTRREGADLQERLRGVKEAWMPAPALLALLLLVPALPAAAVPVDEYVSRLRTLRREVESSRAPADVDELKLRQVRDQLIETPGGGKLSVKNDWLRSSLGSWKKPQDREAILRRLDALERSVGGVAARPRAGAQGSGDRGEAAEADPRAAVKKLLQQPEFQPLAERPELQELVKGLNLGRTRTWWTSLVQWIRNTLFKPADPKVNAPDVKWGNLGFLEPVFYVLLGIAVLYILALLVRWFIERPVTGEARAATMVMDAPPLEASATENALDHTVDEWERFAQQWLVKGDSRQAIRALYLAALVHLHRERRIDYNRAFTNWAYVRHYRGELEQKGILKSLTQVFDEVWYGERACGEERYRDFERGVRELGTPAPVR